MAARNWGAPNHNHPPRRTAVTEIQAYYWAIFKRHPIRAIRLYFQRRKVRKAVRKALDKMFQEMISNPAPVRMLCESDADFRERIQSTLQQNVLREMS
jgi:hypothetical protein